MTSTGQEPAFLRAQFPGVHFTTLHCRDCNRPIGHIHHGQEPKSILLLYCRRCEKWWPRNSEDPRFEDLRCNHGDERASYREGARKDGLSLPEAKCGQILGKILAQVGVYVKIKCPACGLWNAGGRNQSLWWWRPFPPDREGDTLVRAKGAS